MEDKDLLSKDISILQALVEKLRVDNARLLLEQEKLLKEKEKLLAEKEKELALLYEENQKLRYRLNQLLQDKFGAKSEKDKNPEEEAFDEVTLPDNVEEIELAEKEISVAAHTRKVGRKPLPKHLPRIQQIYDLTEAEKLCACGYSLTKIGEEISEQFDIIPAKAQVIQHVKYKYACKHCEETIKTALGPKSPIPKSIASPGLLAHIAVSKFKDHLPLYRQENIFRRMGVDIARNTSSLWMIKAAEVLKPLYKLGHDIIINYDIAYADETRVQVLKEPGRKAEDKSYMWCFIGGSPEQRFVLYHYNVSRAHTVIEDILEGFSGYLHCDGFGGYDAYALDHPATLLGCWMHCRRGFFEVTRHTKSKGLADVAVKQIAKLYRIEEEMKNKKFNFKERYDYRQQHSQPLLLEFKSFLDDNFNKVLPKSPLGKAFIYAVNQWPKLMIFLKDGRLEMDNGLSERKIKPFVMGRKAWLFCNSIAGVRGAEILFSLIGTCDLHGIEPYAYLKCVLTEIPYAKTMAELERLLPFNIEPQKLVIDLRNTS